VEVAAIFLRLTTKQQGEYSYRRTGVDTPTTATR
jgi:hypothetical protein